MLEPEQRTPTLECSVIPVQQSIHGTRGGASTCMIERMVAVIALPSQSNQIQLVLNVLPNAVLKTKVGSFLKGVLLLGNRCYKLPSVGRMQAGHLSLCILSANTSTAFPMRPNRPVQFRPEVWRDQGRTYAIYISTKSPTVLGKNRML